MTKQNFEEIRRKNLEDNQLFLAQLRMTDIRNDFLNSARSIIREKQITKKPTEYKKIEYTTRYKLKVKSGEIPPHIPKWKREKQKKLFAKEQLVEERKRKLLAKEQLLEEQKRELLAKEQLLEEHKRKLRKKKLERKKKKCQFYDPPPKWMSSYQISANSYHRTFEPRHTKIGERIEQELQESLKQDDS